MLYLVGRSGDLSWLRIYDLRDPAFPVLAGELDTGEMVRAVCVDGARAYLAMYEGGLMVVDVTDPQAPSTLGTWGMQLPLINSNGVAVRDDIAYLDYSGGSYFGLAILDVSDPSAPVPIGVSHFSLGTRVTIDFDGDLLFHGGWCYDISVPDDPMWISINGNVPFVVTDQLALFPDTNELVIVDYSDPANPTLHDTVPIPGGASDAAAADGFAYVGSYGGGFFMTVDLQNGCDDDACLGDLDGDGNINHADLAILLGAWGPNPAHSADLNNDDLVNAADLAILLGAWGACP